MFNSTLLSSHFWQDCYYVVPTTMHSQLELMGASSSHESLVLPTSEVRKPAPKGTSIVARCISATTGAIVGAFAVEIWAWKDRSLQLVERKKGGPNGRLDATFDLGRDASDLLLRYLRHQQLPILVL